MIDSNNWQFKAKIEKFKTWYTYNF